MNAERIALTKQQAIPSLSHWGGGSFENQRCSSPSPSNGHISIFSVTSAYQMVALCSIDCYLSTSISNRMSVDGKLIAFNDSRAAANWLKSDVNECSSRQNTC